MPYLFTSLQNARDLPLPVGVESVQCVGELCFLDLESNRAQIADRSSGVATFLSLDTSLIPPLDFPTSGMVHVFGTLRSVMEFDSEIETRILKIEILRKVDGVSIPLLLHSLSALGKKCS